MQTLRISDVKGELLGACSCYRDTGSQQWLKDKEGFDGYRRVESLSRGRHSPSPSPICIALSGVINSVQLLQLFLFYFSSTSFSSFRPWFMYLTPFLSLNTAQVWGNICHRRTPDSLLRADAYNKDSGFILYLSAVPAENSPVICLPGHSAEIFPWNLFCLFLQWIFLVVPFCSILKAVWT